MCCPVTPLPFVCCVNPLPPLISRRTAPSSLLFSCETLSRNLMMNLNTYLQMNDIARDATTFVAEAFQAMVTEFSLEDTFDIDSLTVRQIFGGIPFIAKRPLPDERDVVVEIEV